MNPRSEYPWLYSHVDDTLLVSPRPGALHTIVVNGLTTAGDITVYDSVDATGTVVAVLHLDVTTSISVQPITFTYDVNITTGIYIAYDQAVAADLTVAFI